MHIGILQLADQRIREAFHLFSDLPFDCTVYNPHLIEEVSTKSRALLATYVNFFETVFASNMLCLEDTVVAGKKQLKHFKPHFPSGTDGNLPIRPVHDYEIRPSSLIMRIGIEVRLPPKKIYILHSLSIGSRSIDYSGGHLRYLDELVQKVLDGGREEPENLIKPYGKSYRRFLEDCRIYLGTTLQGFTIKIRMIGVMNDLMFTGLNLKQVAYRNGFPSYHSMYSAFHKRHRFPLGGIPRLYLHK